jgi:L-seryl-tRNA(Ser) seleniumtransferase
LPRQSKQLREIPAVGRLLERPEFRELSRRHGTALVTGLLRERLAALRRSFDAAAAREDALAASVEEAAAALVSAQPVFVVNATGVIIHTNLGRSVLSRAAAGRVAEAATSYLALEYDLAAGKRGSRSTHLEPLLARLFPRRGFAVVNNNAAAILLVLRALASEREVVVSRGELVEIGGSFRVPEILELSGATLREVGTTNRTRLRDYAKAVSSRTGAILKVHASNFRIVGFTEEAGTAELAALARRGGIPLVVDCGSGDLLDLAPFGILDEIPVARILDDGADVVTFSADKLLGGPQAGIVVARRDLAERIRKDPLARVLRLDRLQIAALHHTLTAYVKGTALEEIPTLRMLALTPEEIGARAERVHAAVAERSGREIRIVDGVSKTGGGSSPGGERPTRLLAIDCPEGAARLERALRSGRPPVVARIQAGRVLLDLRTVLPEQDGALADAVVDATRRSGS